MIKQKDSEMYRHTYIMKVRPSQEFGENGENCILGRPNFDGNMGNKDNIGEQVILILANRGTSSV